MTKFEQNRLESELIWFKISIERGSFLFLGCGKRIIQEGPPFVPPQGDRIKGMGGTGLLESAEAGR